MSASLGLFRLQQVDRQIDNIRSQLENIQRILDNDTELHAAKVDLENAKGKHHNAHHALNAAGDDVQALNIKIELAESSLYSGKVQNPKELQDLQKDVLLLKKHLVTLEERELEAMINAEGTENTQQAENIKLELIQARVGNEHKKLIEEQSSLELKLEQLAEEREASLSPIEANLLQIYENLRRLRRGVAVTDVSDNSCTSCGATITNSLQQNARSQKQLAHCPSCGRILFAN